MPVDEFVKGNQYDKDRNTPGPCDQHFFFLPIESQSINLKRGMMILGTELHKVQVISKFSPGVESIC